MTPYQLEAAILQEPGGRMQETSWTAQLITKYQFSTWHLFKATQKKMHRKEGLLSVLKKNWLDLVTLCIPYRNTNSWLTQFTIYSSKKFRIFPYATSSSQMESISASWCRELYGFKRNFCCCFIWTAFQPHYKQHQTAFQSLVLRHNSYCTHLDKWVTWFLGTRKRFLLSLLPTEHSKKQKHYSPRNSITLKDTTEIPS